MGTLNGKLSQRITAERAIEPPSSSSLSDIRFCSGCARGVPPSQECKCARCGFSCCPHNVVSKTYGSSAAHSTKTLICFMCNRKPNVVDVLPRTVWMTLQEYCDMRTQQNLLQLCHATQLGVRLPYPYGRFGWSSFFTTKVFLSKGANGSAFKTTLRQDIPDAVWGDEVTCATASMPCWSGVARKLLPSVAVKTIQKSNVYSLRKWQVIHREVEALCRCQHPHVVELLFVSQGPSEVYIVLQYVSGGDLFDWLVRQQIPSEDDVAVIAEQLLTTLHFLHEECGVAHRDIKPENILVDTESAADPRGLFIKLADFGYAKLLPTPTASPESTPDVCAARAACMPPPMKMLPPLPRAPSSGNRPIQRNDLQFDDTAITAARRRRHQRMVSATPCGTLGFAAPEILSAYNAQREAAASRGDHSQHAPTAVQGGSNAFIGVGPQTSVEDVKKMDIFACGVTLAILLTGCEPFPCMSSREHLNAVLTGVDFSGPQWSYVSQSAKCLLRCMLASRASDRPTAMACLHSPWLERHRATADVATADSWNKDILLAKEVGQSFRQSLHSLHKSDGWIFVQSPTGGVTTAPREIFETDDAEATLLHISERALEDVNDRENSTNLPGACSETATPISFD